MPAHRTLAPARLRLSRVRQPELIRELRGNVIYLRYRAPLDAPGEDGSVQPGKRSAYLVASIVGVFMLAALVGKWFGVVDIAQ